MFTSRSSVASKIMSRYQIDHESVAPDTLPHLSPTESEPDGGWLLDTTLDTDVQVADQALWQEVVPPGDLDPGLEPVEYRTLFENKGFIFNTGMTSCYGSQGFQVPRPARLEVSPSSEQLAALINPLSPGHRQLAAIIRAPQPPLSLALLRQVELDPGVDERELASPRGRFLRTATNLHTRLTDLDSETSCLIYDSFLLRHGFQELLATTDYLVRQSKRLQRDLRDVIYLNDLLWMLRGRLDNVTPRRWPFMLAHLESVTEVNLVV